MSYKPRILNPELPLHLTARANNRDAFPMPLPELWPLFSDYLFFIHHVFGIRILSFVMMPNHIHLIVRDPEMKLSPAMNYFMRETSKQISKESHKINRIWGAPFHSSLICSDTYFLHAYKYVYRNPVRANLCETPAGYDYSTLPALLGRTRTVIPLEEDLTLFENVEKSVHWLNQSPDVKDTEQIRLALRRKEFRPPRDESTKLESHLASEASVPEIFRKGRAFPDGKALPPGTECMMRPVF